MTNQTKLAGVGAIAFAVTKFYFKKDMLTSAFAATAAMSVIALFRARNVAEGE